MHTSAERKPRAGNLRDPPEATKRGVAAGHHAAADIVHHCGADLGGRINGVGVREGTKQRVAFRAVVGGDGATCGIGVEGRGAVAGGHEGEPEFLLARRGSGTFHGGF